MAEISSLKLVNLIPLLAYFFYPLHVTQDSFTCQGQIENGINALSNSIVYDTEFRGYAIDYFNQWNSTANYSTEFEDFLESSEEEPALADPNYINIAIDTIFKAAYKPSLGFPYQYVDVDMETVAKAGTEKHSITQQPIRSTDDILKNVPCRIQKLGDINNRIIFGSKDKIQYVNVLVSDYFQNNKYGCVELSMIPSRMPQVMRNKKNFDSYYFRITLFFDLNTMKIEFHSIGTELLFYGPYSITDTLATFIN